MSENPSHHGNADWSHVRETINMLYLAVCQIESTLDDSDHSVNTLTLSFTDLANKTHSICKQVAEANLDGVSETFQQNLGNTAAELQGSINQSIQAFQFYDRVCQRLHHVSNSLEQVTSIMGKNELLANPEEWKNVQHKIKSSYTMESEHIMFEFIMRGGNVEEALQIYKHHFEKEQEKDEDGDEIELF